MAIARSSENPQSTSRCSWPRPVGKRKHPAINYQLIETWRQFRFLVEVYGFTKDDPQAKKRPSFFFLVKPKRGYQRYPGQSICNVLHRRDHVSSHQAGYQDDPRIEKGFQWLLSMRQDDQGWTVPSSRVILTERPCTT